MKKLMYIATALLVLVGCKKDNALNTAPEGTPFKQGQQVTLTIGTGDNANQAAPRRVAGTDNTTNNRIDFTWEEGDKILVKVGDKTAVFELISASGSTYGEFAGTMPADGSTFDIQYPTEAPDLNAQVYSSTQIDAKQMLFTATGCTLGNDAFLNAQYAMVQLNLYGADKTIGKIVFKSSASPAVSCTLTCPEGVEIGANSEGATPFYMVVPVGEYKFKADIYNNAEIPANMCWLIPSAAQTFTAGKCLNMPAKEVIVVYEGSDNGHAWVNLGLSVVWATTNVGVTTPNGVGTKYYVSDLNNIWGGNWRLPTADEWQELLDHTTEQRLAPPTLPGSIGNTNDYGWQYSSKSNSEKFIFLPFTNIDFNLGYNGYEYGDYWSSTDDGEGGKYYYRSGSEHDDANYVTKVPSWTRTAALNARLVCDVWN